MEDEVETATNVVHFSSGDFDRQERLERLEAAASAIFRVEPADKGSDIFADWTLWQAKDLVFSKIAFSPFRFERNPKFSGQDQPLLLMESYSSGTGHAEIEDRSASIGPNGLHLIDLTRRYRNTATMSVVYGALIPHDAVGYDPGLHPPYVSLSVDTPVGRSLISAFQAVLSRLPTAFGDDAATLASGLSAVIRALILANNREADRSVFRGALALSVRAHIDANLHDPTLNIEKLYQTFGVSRATLYRMLEEFGGIDAYVRGRRLEHCHHALKHALPEHGGVKRISRQWGFLDTDRFHRLYKERFERTPGEDLNTVEPPRPRPISPASDQDVIRIFETILRAS